MKQAIPVAGVDVSKRFSDMCVLAPNNEILARIWPPSLPLSLRKSARRLTRCSLPITRKRGNPSRARLPCAL